MGEKVEIHPFSHEAMTTEWKLQIAHPDPALARSAANEAFDRVDQLERELSRFRPDSDISILATLSPGESHSVSRAVFECLELAKAVHAETEGAFDISLTPLYDPRRCSPDSAMGMEKFVLEREVQRVTVTHPHLYLDLGGVGKGYALDEMVALFGEWDIEDALMIAGNSTLIAMGRPPGAEAWPVQAGPDPEEPYPLTDQALSASGFAVQGLHIFDPRTGLPLETNRQRSWAFADSAALADALSTAVLIMGETEIAAFCDKHPEITIMIV